MRRPLDMRVDQARRIDPITGCDAEDLFAQVEWYQARGLIHPNDDTHRQRQERNDEDQEGQAEQDRPALPGEHQNR